MVDLKQDKAPFTKITYLVGKDKQHCPARRYVNAPIDCYHRLSLSVEELGLLDELARVMRKAKRAAGEKKDELLRRIDELNIQFVKGFENPYFLDFEIFEEIRPTTFVFFDYEYDYFVVKSRDGWTTYCSHSDFMGGGFCEQDALYGE